MPKGTVLQPERIVPNGKMATIASGLPPLWYTGFRLTDRQGGIGYVYIVET